MRLLLRRAAFLFSVCFAGITSAPGQGSVRYGELQRQASAYYSEKSYALAHQAWTEAATLDVPAGDRRTLEFYLADSLWRSRPDAAQVAEARRRLEAVARAEDSLAAEAAESLGDSWLALENDWERGWIEYRRALKFWAASTDLESARGRYLGIVWKATGPPGRDQWREARVPAEVLANALQIAPNDEERARAHFFLGRRDMATSGIFSQRRAGREFQTAVDAGGGTAVYEAALFELAEWNLVAGMSHWGADGGLTLEPDYDRALELFRRFAREFPKGDSARYAQAAARIEQITKPLLEVQTGNQFLPGAKPVVHARWRNVDEVRLTLTRVDLERDFRPTGRTSPGNWLDAVRAEDGAMVRRWTEVESKGARHAPREKDLELAAVEEPGTYLLEAGGGGLTARALVVVTAGAAVVQAVGDQVVAYFCDARTGEHAKAAPAKLWRVREVDDHWRWQAFDGGGSEDGLVTFAISKSRAGGGGQFFVFGSAGIQPVVAPGYASDFGEDGNDWRIQAFTDRAAYRPADTVRWKLIARKRANGVAITPAGELLKFVISDPHDVKVDEGEVKLTEFGGAWGELPLRADLPLGEYAIRFLSGQKEIGGGALFRLEEYRLPEFKVSVAAAGDEKVVVRLGDEFEVKVSAKYYFGGAVTDAKVAVEVREEPFARPVPWEKIRGRSLLPPSGGGRVVKNETVRTGPEGTASLRVPTAREGGQDLRYTITARVTDASGREVVATSSMVVARQGYFADLTPSRRVAAPKDSVKISIEAKTGDGLPVATAGVVTITRQQWSEVWLDPQGREVTGAALDARKHGIFPPPGEAGWRMVKREYVSEEVSRVDAATDAEGKGSCTFRPDAPGFYCAEWSSPDGEGPPVTAVTNVWVSNSAGGLLGYRSGGVEVIVDPTAPARGGKVPVLITTDTSNRDVFLLVHAGGDLFRAEVVHLDGDSKLVELESGARFVPNVFVTAATVRGLQFFADTQEIKFPPYRNTLAVELRAKDPASLPGAEGSLRLVVKDDAGRPVRGEFALAVTDEAVSAIQEDYAGDPVDFFFGEPRSAGGGAASSVTQSPFYVKSEPPEHALAEDGTARGRKVQAFAADGEEFAEASMSLAMAAPDPAEARAARTAPVVAVRSNFNATALWQPGIVTNDDGEAAVKFKYPDSLTTWRAVLRGATVGAKFGFAEITTQTTKPLIARLQAPRFLIAGDQVDISGVVNNRADAPLTAQVDLHVEGLSGTPKTWSLSVPSNGDARAAWKLDAPEPGVAKLTLTAGTANANDATRLSVPIYPNNIDAAVSVSGKATGSESVWQLPLPAPRRPGSESLLVTATPSLAAAMLDALPYLIRYPYGCVEQTMSRFLPAAVTARTLQSLGLDRKAVANRIFGGIEPEFLAKTHPKMEGSAGIEELDAAIAQGLVRLADLQREDGAWGWWKGGESDAFMTAYVVWGLRLAQQAGVAVRSDLLDRGSAWLRLHLVDAQDDPNLQAWILHALAARHEAGRRVEAEPRAALENLWNRRDQLTTYGHALFALAAHDFDDKAKAEVLVRNLRDGVIRDARPDGSTAAGVAPGNGNSDVVPTAHWGSDGSFHAWQDGGVEATAFALRAMLAIEPQSDLVEPAMNWLVKNRRGAQWSNTRDTAIAVLAINQYLAATKELGHAVSFEILVNGKKAGEAKNVTALAGLSRFEIDRAFLRDGDNAITLRRTAGDAAIYLSAQARYFTLADPIAAAGNGIFVRREYLRYVPQLTLLDGYRFDRVPWSVGEIAARDQRIEVVLTVEAKNDLEYVLLEDLKPAGLETSNLRSGEFLEAKGEGGRRVPIYCELRDRKVALFIRKLPAGVWTIRYDLRTETSGDFSALPVRAQAMYAPEIRANGESRRVLIGVER